MIFNGPDIDLEGTGPTSSRASMQVVQAEGLIAEQGPGSSEVLPQQTETKGRSIERGRKVEGRGGGERRRGTLRILEGTPSPFQKLVVHYSELNFLAFNSCSGWKHGPD